MADVAKQLSIKTNAVKRIFKEIGSYEKEAQQQQEKVNKMKGDPKYDDHDVRKQEEVLAETVAMIPDAKKRLDNAAKDLHNFVVCNAGGKELQTKIIKRNKMNQVGWIVQLRVQFWKKRVA